MAQVTYRQGTIMDENKKNPNTVDKPVKKTVNVDQALQSFDKPNVEPPKKKGGLVSLFVLPIVIALGLYCMIQLVGEINSAEQAWSFKELLNNISVKYLLLALGVILVVILIESFKYVIVTHAVTGKPRLLNSIKVALVGKYYDGITPFSAGGQPMQRY